jgi:hypothetical protein
MKLTSDADAIAEPQFPAQDVIFVSARTDRRTAPVDEAKVRAVAGLVGVISHDRGVSVPKAELTEMLDAYRRVRRGGEELRLAARNWAGVAIIHSGPRATIEKRERSWFAAVGAVHWESDPWGEPAREFDGQFAAVRYDGPSDELQVLTDPFGMQALYVATRDARTYVCTSATVLARHLGSEPDVLGMQVFLRAGIQIGPMTLWRGVERLDPAVALSFAGGAPRRSVYWAPAVEERVRRMSQAQTIDHCVEVGMDVVRRRLQAPRAWMDITGGFDSRMVASLLSAVGFGFIGNTNGDDDSADVRLAHQLAEAGQFRWEHIRHPAEWVMDPPSMSQAVAWSDGSLDMIQLADVLQRHEYKRALSERVVTGGGGEHFNSFPWQQEFLRAGRTHEVNYRNLLSMRYLKHVDISMLARDPERDVMDYFHECLRNRAAHYRNEPNTTQLDAIYAYKSVGHFGAFRSASEALVRTEIPCYYRDIFVAAFSAHHRWRTNHRLQRGIIERLNPAMAAVPTTHGGTAQRVRLRNAYQLVPYLAFIGRRAAVKLSRAGRPAPSSPVSASAAARYRLASQLLQQQGVFDTARMQSAAMYDGRALSAFVTQSESGGFTGWGMLGRIGTLELALRNATASDRSLGPW